MKINWLVRVKNPVFWANIGVSIVLPILTYLGVNWTDITTWAQFGEILAQAVSNPVIVVAVAMSVWNAINDPTTSGLSDSSKALTYSKPNKE